MYSFLLILGPLACSAPDADAGIEHVRMIGPSLKQVLSQIRLGMKEQNVLGLLRAGHLPSGNAISVHRLTEHEFIVDVGKFHWIEYSFIDGKLVKISHLHGGD